MIQLIRPDKPQKLAEQEIELTKMFIADKNAAVWKKAFIQNPLLEMTHNKCSYCERKIGRKFGQDVHMDHFKCKDKYPDSVVDWKNLFPSCARCNRDKSIHDVIAQPIINPVEMNPKDYLFIFQYRYYSKTNEKNDIGRCTLNVLTLNDSDDCCLPRFQLCNALAEKISDLYQLALDKGDTLENDTVSKNKILNGCRKLLKKCLPTAEYSAFMATSLHTDENFLALKDILAKKNLWDEDLVKLFDESKYSVYDTHR